MPRPVTLRSSRAAHNPNALPGASDVKRREWIVIAIILAALLALAIAATGAILCITHRFIIDEIVTSFLVTDPSLTHMINAVRHGVDSNVPGLELFLRGLAGIGMPITETSLRLVSIVAAWVGLLLLYGSLRRHVDRLSASVAVIGALSTSLLAAEMFQARCYCLWFFATAAIVYLLPTLRRQSLVSWRHLMIMLLVIFSISLHYFGIFAVAAIITGDVLLDRRAWIVRAVARWPLWLGLLAAAAYPVFYFPQRRSLASGTWALPTTLHDVIIFLYEAFAVEQLACVLIIGIAAIIACKLFPKIRARWQPINHPELLGSFIGLAFFALFVALFSYFVTPAAMGRYAIPALLAATAFIAFILAAMPAAFRVVVLVAFLSLLGIRLHRKAIWTRDYDAEVKKEASFIAALPAHQPIWCESVHSSFPLTFYYPQYAERIYLLYAPHVDPQYIKPNTQTTKFEHDFVLATHDFFPQFQTAQAPLDASHLPMAFICFAREDDRLAHFFAPNIPVHVAGNIYEIIAPSPAANASRP